MTEKISAYYSKAASYCSIAERCEQEIIEKNVESEEKKIEINEEEGKKELIKSSGIEEKNIEKNTWDIIKGIVGSYFTVKMGVLRKR